MPAQCSRRQLLAAAGSVAATAAAPPHILTIDAHIHLFDPARFPFHPNATYRPPPQPLEPYSKFVKQAKIDHTVLVHPEPYQDDHRYLEYCFAHEPSPGFFKGTCLFDPIDPQTPARIRALAERNPGRIVALRIHEMRKPGTPPTTSGAIHDRDLKSPAMRETWRHVYQLGLAIQMHFIPYYAPQIGALAAQFPAMPVILDHLARAGQGTRAEYAEVLKLARLPRVYMKLSALEYSSRQPFPYRDAKPLVRQACDAFGADRMIWGGLGHSLAEFKQQSELFDYMLDFLSGADRAKIRGLNAATLFHF
ncbi:MAG: amidohydrolase family protein [Bryobacteraceae bacterium]